MRIKFSILEIISTSALIAISSLAGWSLGPEQALAVEAQSLISTAQHKETGYPRGGFTRYTESGLYTIDYPDSWLLSKPAPQVTSVLNRQPSDGGQGYPPNFISTEIFFRSESLEAALQHLLRTDDSRYRPGTLTRRGNLTVGGKNAVRLWFAGGQFGEDRIVTLIRYSDSETAVISSYFTSGETWGIPTIQNMHWSFRSQ